MGDDSLDNDGMRASQLDSQPDCQPEAGRDAVKFNLTKRKKNSLDGYFWGD
jgi:hypothetical protein